MRDSKAYSFFYNILVIYVCVKIVNSYLQTIDNSLRDIFSLLSYQKKSLLVGYRCFWYSLFLNYILDDYNFCFWRILIMYDEHDIDVNYLNAINKLKQ